MIALLNRFTFLEMVFYGFPTNENCSDPFSSSDIIIWFPRQFHIQYVTTQFLRAKLRYLVSSRKKNRFCLREVQVKATSSTAVTQYFESYFHPSWKHVLTNGRYSPIQKLPNIEIQSSFIRTLFRTSIYPLWCALFIDICSFVNFRYYGPSVPQFFEQYNKIINILLEFFSILLLIYLWTIDKTT